MKQLKEKFAVKAVSFALILLCAVIMVFSVITIGFNLRMEGYHKSEEDIEAEIYGNVAAYVSDEIAEEMYGANVREIPSKDGMIFGYPDDQEIIEGESRNAENFGYRITL